MSEHNVTFLFRDKNVEPIEFQLKKPQLAFLIDHFNTAISKLYSASFTPRKSLFVIK